MHFEVVDNILGEKRTPSYVTISEENEIVVGTLAKNQQITNPTRTIFDLKRFIGAKTKEKQVKKVIETTPFKI